jgi:hypothetical protein
MVSFPAWEGRQSGGLAMKYLVVREEGTVAMTDDWEPFNDAWEAGIITHIVNMQHCLQYEGGGNWRDIEAASYWDNPP